MENNINNRLKQVMNWLRMSIYGQDAVYVLIEILAFKSKAKDNEEINGQWARFVDPANGRDEQIETIKHTFSMIGWESLYLQRLFVESKEELVIRDLLSFVDGLNLNKYGDKIAWELINYFEANYRQAQAPISLPHELSKLIGELLDLSREDSVNCIGEMSAGIALEINSKVNDIRIQTQLSNYLLEMLLTIAGVRAEVIHSSLSYEAGAELSNIQFTKSVILPPWYSRIDRDMHRALEFSSFYIKPSSIESYYIQKALRNTKSRVVVVMPPGFLFKTAGTDQDLKKYLIEEGLIEGIIKLPARLFSTTGVMPAVMIINKMNRTDKILFVDATSEKYYEEVSRSLNKLRNIESIIKLILNKEDTSDSRLIDNETLRENEYNLDPNRYVLSSEEEKLYKILKEENTRALGDLVNIKRAQSVKGEEEGSKVKEVNPADIDKTGYLKNPKKEVMLSIETESKFAKQKLQPGNIVLAVKGSVGRVGMIPEDVENNWYAGQSFVVLEVKKDSPIKDPIVLYRYLASDLAQSQLLSKAAGATVKLIKMNDIKSMPIIVPTMEEQDKIIENQRNIERLYQTIEQTNEKISDLRSEYWGLK